MPHSGANYFIATGHCDCDHDLPSDCDFGRNGNNDLGILCDNQEEMVLILPQVKTRHGQQVSVEKISKCVADVVIEGFERDIIGSIVLTTPGEVITFVNYNNKWYFI